jgi:ribosomal protein L4
MKADVLNIKGQKIKEIELPKFFLFQPRGDIILKIHEAMRKKQPYAPFLWAGMQYSASGKIKHARRKWKTAYGYGISRVPRKIMSRSGTRFSWVGATVASARGGRAAHPPKIVNMLVERKINKKEKLNGLFYALAATSSFDVLNKNYPNMIKNKISFPLIIDSLNQVKTKDIVHFIKSVLTDYQKDKKPLLVVSSKEEVRSKIFDVSKVNELSIKELCPSGKPGRLCIYTENAIGELRNLK